MELPIGMKYNAFLLKMAVAQKKVTQAAIDGHVRNVLRTMFAFGVFDRQAYPGTNKNVTFSEGVMYAKVTLAPDQSAKVTFPLSARSFAYWNEGAKAWKVADGCYRVMVGYSSRNIAQTGTVGACR